MRIKGEGGGGEGESREDNGEDKLSMQVSDSDGLLLLPSVLIPLA